MPATEFKDKHGQVIYTGDIVISQLGKFSKKSGGPSILKVFATKKGPYLYYVYQGEWSRLSPLRASDSSRLTIYDKSEREK